METILLLETRIWMECVSLSDDQLSFIQESDKQSYVLLVELILRDSVVYLELQLRA